MGYVPAPLAGADHKKAMAVINRFAAIREAAGLPIGEKLPLLMDLSAVHARIPLDFDAMLEARPADLAHDLSGIMLNLNRSNGELENGFVPRLALAN